MRRNSTHTHLLPSLHVGICGNHTQSILYPKPLVAMASEPSKIQRKRKRSAAIDSASLCTCGIISTRFTTRGTGGTIPTKMVGNPSLPAIYLAEGSFGSGTIARTIGHCKPDKFSYNTHGATAKNIEPHPHEPRPLFRVRCLAPTCAGNQRVDGARMQLMIIGVAGPS